MDSLLKDEAVKSPSCIYQSKSRSIVRYSLKQGTRLCPEAFGMVYEGHGGNAFEHPRFVATEWRIGGIWEARSKTEVAVFAS
ncbi:MAG: hypothetical protein P8L49_17420 [Opitutaceae bacterium]|nr:hypothetical protein [Opitutaceae bacterium]